MAIRSQSLGAVALLISFSQNFRMSWSGTFGLAAFTWLRQSFISACASALFGLALESDGGALGGGSAVLGAGVTCATAAVAAMSASRAKVGTFMGGLLS
jgi:hypothetical protein